LTKIEANEEVSTPRIEDDHFSVFLKI